MVDKEKVRILFNEKKYDEVKILLKNEEDHKDPFIQFVLASLYNLDQDYEKAIIHFLNAANLGYNEAERALGIYYYQGYGCNKDETKGRYWVEKAIEDGNIRAYCTLAHIYMNGLGTNKDEHQAFLLYKKAAELGDEHAKEHLIECYIKGIGTQIDIAKANEIKNQG